MKTLSCKNLLIFSIFFLKIIACYHPTIYEISTRPWLYELSQKYKKNITTLKDIPLEEFDKLAEKGVEYVWMMGVWQLGSYGLELDRKKDYSSVLPDYKKEDIIGSPYAITEYVCNSEIGTDEDLKWLKETLHKKNLKLLLDFVPNHSAVDSPTAETYPNFYIRVPKGQSTWDSKYYTDSGIAYGKDPYFDPWPDVIQWNYFDSNTRQFMLNNLMKVISLSDGVRCDMAHLMLNDVFKKTWEKELNSWGYIVPSSEFWGDAIKTVKDKYPDALFLAEVYEDWEIQKLYELGFDYCYDKALLDKFELNSYDINDYIHYKTEDFFGHVSHFIENHDENRGVYNMGSVEKSDAAGTIAATVGGMIFLNHGQWDGLRNKLDVHLRRGADEDVNVKAQQHYNKLMDIIKDKAFHSGNYYFVYNMSGDAASRFVAYLRNDENNFLVVVNYSDNYGCANVPIYNIKGTGDIKVYEMFSDIEYTRNAETIRNSGLTVCLEAYQSQIFKYNYSNNKFLAK